VDVSADENIWNGTYTDATHTMYISQNGENIQVFYTPFDRYLDAGILEGALSTDGRIFSGRWIESTSQIWNLSEDRMSYSAVGYRSQISELPERMPWNTQGTRVGEITDPVNIWSGVWKSTRSERTITQDGTSVTGIYHRYDGPEKEDGVVEGTVSDDGKTLTINLTESGYFSFILSDDGQYFNGTYSWHEWGSYKTDSWNMTKVQ